MKQFIDSVLKSKIRKAMPVMTHPGIEALGYTVKQAVSDGLIQYEAIKYVADNFDTIACMSMMDLTVEAEAFGAKVNFPDHEIPTVSERLLADSMAISALKVPTLDAGRIPQYLLANRLAAENIKSKPVFSGCIGPFSLAGRLYDMSEIMVAIYIEPDAMIELLSKCTDFMVNYCNALKATGTQGVIIAEPAAGLLSNEDCLTYSTQFMKRIVDAVQDDSFTVILHNCGNTGQCTNAMIESGARALHFGNAINMQQVLAECPSEILVFGNLDPVSVFKQGSPDSIQHDTKVLFDKAGKYSNFVFSSGCDIPPYTPEVNIRAFLDALNQYQ